MLSGLFNFLNNNSTYNDPRRSEQSRVTRYIRFKRLYDGYALRSTLNGALQYSKLKYNLSRPIINVSADFLAARPISFWVAGDDEKTEMCKKIWLESSGDGAFLENALLAGILGDSCVMVTKGEEDDVAKLKFVDPTICTPIFDPHDCDKLEMMIFAYEIPQIGGGVKKYYEEWKDGQVHIQVDGQDAGSDTYDHDMFGGLPMEWIKNIRMKGEAYGRSDADGIEELVEQYDHLSNKQSRILDYYAAPNMYTKGVAKGSMQVTKGERSVYHLPVDGEIGFIEWNGQLQSMDNHLNRIKENISEISETPQIAFSKLDAGMNDVSGVALKLLFNPLLSKTNRKRSSWTPSLIKAMRKALLVEGIEVDEQDISILWQSPLPSNDLEDWQISTIKDTLGVSKSQILKERGYTEEQIEEMQKEKDEEAKSLAATMLKDFNTGKVPGSPYDEKKEPKKEDKDK